MARLIATQVAVKDLIDILHTETDALQEHEKAVVNPKLSLKFKGIVKRF